jgi:hypothetical protein
LRSKKDFLPTTARRWASRESGKRGLSRGTREEAMTLQAQDAFLCKAQNGVRGEQEAVSTDIDQRQHMSGGKI